jgi:hypothetical protein
MHVERKFGKSSLPMSSWAVVDAGWGSWSVVESKADLKCSVSSSGLDLRAPRLRGRAHRHGWLPPEPGTAFPNPGQG